MSSRNQEGMISDFREMDTLINQLEKVSKVGSLLSGESSETITKKMKATMASLKRNSGIGILTSVK